AQPPGGQHLLGPQHRRGLDLIAGEHPGRGVVRPLVEHQRQIQRAGGLDAGGDPGGAEAGGCGDALGPQQLAHGATPTTVRPSVSGQPSARFIDCTAAPPVPFTRLSMAAIATNVLASVSTAIPMWAALLPSTAPVLGSCPSGSTNTKGSSAYAFS